MACIYLFKKGMRRGISLLNGIVKQIINTWNHDVNEPSKFIMCLDENNLYGCAMSQYLPYSGFKWLN